MDRLLDAERFRRACASLRSPLGLRAVTVGALAVMIAAVAAPVAFAQGTSPFDDPSQFPFVPVILQSMVKGIIAWAFINGLKAVGDAAHKDFSGWAGLFIVGVGGMVLYILNGVIGSQSPDLQQAIGYFCQLVLALLFAMGYKRTEVKARAPSPVVLETAQARITPQSSQVELKRG